MKTVEEIRAVDVEGIDDLAPEELAIWKEEYRKLVELRSV